MRGFVGTDVDLQPGDEIGMVDPPARIVIIRQATEAEAVQSAASLGHVLKVQPGEHFYEVEYTVMPLGGNN